MEPKMPTFPPTPFRDPAPGGYLTPQEHAAMRDTARLWNRLTSIVGDGTSREADLAELATDIHRIQERILAQAAARAYPKAYRLLGETIGTPEPSILRSNAQGIEELNADRLARRDAKDAALAAETDNPKETRP